MDPIEAFINSKQKFSLNLLVNAHQRLSVVQLLKGCVTYEEALFCFKCQITGQQQYSLATVTAHCGLIFESVIATSISAGGVKLQVNKEVIGNDETYINCILAALQKRCTGGEYPFVDEFRREATAYLRKMKEIANGGTATPVPVPPSPVPANVPKAPEPAPYEELGGLAAGFMSKPASKPYLVPSAALQAQIPIQLPPPPHIQNAQQQQQQQQSQTPGVVEYDGPVEHKYAPARVEFERAEPIVRLLAQVRKVGMDILFPQSTHDKILAIIFVAVKSFATPAHRELIDMVMAVKEANKATQLEPVSKTKIRGVLALLKHGELLITQGDYGEPVRLFLAPGIETFKDLRERHDLFLTHYMMDHHLFIPTVLRSELVWQVDEETRQLRLTGMDAQVKRLKQFFGSIAEYSAVALEREDGTSTDNLRKVSSPPGASTGGPGGYAGRGAGAGGRSGAAGRGPQGAPAGGRGYGAYGAGGRYGQQYPPYAGGGRFGNTAGAYEGNYGAAGGYGRGGYTAAGSRAQFQRYANAQASSNMANNEEYAEMANGDWSDADSAAASTATAKTSSGGNTQSPEYDSTKLNPSAKAFGPPATARAVDPSASEAMNFDFAPRQGGSASSVLSTATAAPGTSRLPGISLSGGMDDSAWLPQSAAGQSNYAMWNDAGSSFFNSPPAPGTDTSLEGDASPLSPLTHGNETLNLSLRELNRNALPFPAPSTAGLMRYGGGDDAASLDMDMDMGLDFGREFDKHMLLGGADSDAFSDPFLARTSPGERVD